MKKNTDRSAVYLEHGSVKNTGLIEYNRDEKFELINGIAVDLLQIGLEYNRDTIRNKFKRFYNRK